VTVIQAYDLTGNPTGTLTVPKVFETPIRPDVVKRAVLTQQSHRFQPQGRDPMAGKRTTATSLGTGLGIARMARVKGSGNPRARQAAFIPSAVGGRRTHPPKAEKRIAKKMNTQERRLAIRSAIAATADKSLVAARGHLVDAVPSLPLVVSDDLQAIQTAKQAKDVFTRLGLLPDVDRVKRSLKIRAGKGTMRGRRRRHGVGPLFVIAEDRGITKAVNNFLGIDVISVRDLNAEALAPGTNVGRLTVWSKAAFRQLDDVFV
jgi:large subunit ribosomal protein L4e